MVAVRPGTRLVVGLSLLTAAGAAFFVFAALEARERRNPASVVLGGKRYDVRDLDLPPCAENTTMVVDVDMDDLVDLYVVGCGRHGLMKRRGERVVFVDLGDVDPDDAPGLRSLWAREIRDGGGTFVTAGLVFGALTAAGLAWLVAAVLRRKSQ